MKVIIAGSRTISDRRTVEKAIEDSGFLVTEVVCGGASGVDAVGRQYAFDNNIRCSLFPAEWDKFKKRAGPIRNRAMAEYADALVAVWDGKSRGTWSMMREMERLGKPVFGRIPL